jgi:hypothetical protein
MNNSIPPLMRGIGSFFILIATVASAIVTSYAQKASQCLPHIKMNFNLSHPYTELSEQEKKERHYKLILNNITSNVQELHQDMKKNTFVSTITADPRIAWMTYLGSFVIMLSFFVEWIHKRRRDQPAAKANADERLSVKVTVTAPHGSS